MLSQQRGQLDSSLIHRGEADGAPTVSDRSPLIANATSPPPLIADATAFDNAAITDQPTENTSVTGQLTSGVDCKLTDSPQKPGHNVSATETTATKVRSTGNKKRKVLSIVSDAFSSVQFSYLSIQYSQFRSPRLPVH